MKRIIVLTDFSETSSVAVNSAINCASEYTAELLIWHVMDQDEIVVYELDHDNDFRIIKDGADVSFNLLENWRSRMLQKGIKGEVILSTGPVNTMLKQMREYNPNMIYLGRKGNDDTQNEIGSFAREVVKVAKVPVFIIDKELVNLEFEKIVFASKFDTEERTAFQKMLSLLNESEKSAIHLLSIDTVGYFTEPSVAVKESMSKFGNLAPKHNIKYCLFRDYTVQAGIRHYLDQIGADLLVMNGKGNNVIKRLFQKNAALESALNSNVPVLIIY